MLSFSSPVLLLSNDRYLSFMYGDWNLRKLLNLLRDILCFKICERLSLSFQKFVCFSKLMFFENMRQLPETLKTTS